METGPKTRRLPAWLRRPVARGPAVSQVRRLLRANGLHTVCEEAGCPNLGECFNNRTATFMILGNVCTRGCRFCGVEKGVPEPLNESEPEAVAQAALDLGLNHVVITSVTRDDLDDGGASIFARTICSVRNNLPRASIEVLIPDFMGSSSALETVLDAGPDVLNHNVETVPRLYPVARPQADYVRSLKLLERASKQCPAKSGLMLGLGESRDEVVSVLEDLRKAGVTMVTIGQYLRPGKTALPVHEYVPPRVFEDYGAIGKELGFDSVFSGPLVRSSYHAALQLGKERGNA